MIKFSNGTLIMGDKVSIYTPVGDLMFKNGECNDKIKVLNDLLELSLIKKDLIYIDSYRSMGFSTALNNFSKIKNLPLIVPSNTLKKIFKDNKNVYSISDIQRELYKGKRHYIEGLFLIDSGVCIKDLPSAFKYIGFTNMYIDNSINESDTSDDYYKPKDLLRREMFSLGRKIESIDKENNTGTYKNLILAYKEVLSLSLQLADRQRGMN